jgi:hypothetical protein
MIVLKVKKFKTHNMVVTNVGELLSFHPIFNPVINLGITLDNTTLVILFSKTLKISKITSFKSQNIVKNISFVEMKISKLTKCLMNIC